MTTLQQLIKDNNLSYVNPDITDKNFPQVDFSETDFKVFSFDRGISSEDAISEMEKDGYRAANIYELLTWNKTNKENGLFVALGSCINLDDRLVPCLDLDGGERELRLDWWSYDWSGHCRFLAVRKSSHLASEPLALEPALDVLAPRSEIMWENLKKNDCVKDRYGNTRVVLSRLDELVFLSQVKETQEEGWATRFAFAQHIEELKCNGYTIVQPNKTPRKVTLAEIAEKFGEEVEIVE